MNVAAAIYNSIQCYPVTNDEKTKELLHRFKKTKRLSTKELMSSNCGAGEDSVPWTARRSNKSILKEINPEYSLEGLILKLKPQYFGHQMVTANSLEIP